ncbi:hypothetical protein CALVIDRAFT_99294 [Calocera viscosa TUFC12733]|uniref:Uncharacterized protein n=1 Tax=Calocera viscosa (strain TUFC12733) TaxID=1330018 RepID=A0A167MJG8_CALVF|nr:hypothetical protein CALVIDRAFT_99294 [Calocera viscosa TUFC12733]
MIVRLSHSGSARVGARGEHAVHHGLDHLAIDACAACVDNDGCHQLRDMHLAWRICNNSNGLGRPGGGSMKHPNVAYGGRACHNPAGKGPRQWMQLLPFRNAPPPAFTLIFKGRGTHVRRSRRSAWLVGGGAGSTLCGSLAACPGEQAAQDATARCTLSTSAPP